MSNLKFVRTMFTSNAMELHDIGQIAVQYVGECVCNSPPRKLSPLKIGSTPAIYALSRLRPSMIAPSHN